MALLDGTKCKINVPSKMPSGVKTLHGRFTSLKIPSKDLYSPFMKTRIFTVKSQLPL